MRTALNEITIDNEQRVKLKAQTNINSPLFKKRIKKTNENANTLTSSMVSVRLNQDISSESSNDISIN